MKTIGSLLITGYMGSDGYTPQTSRGEYLRILPHRKENVSSFHAGKKSGLHYSYSPERFRELSYVLQKEPGRDFTVLDLADLHFSDYGYRVLFSLETESVARMLVSYAKPDLIILSGDMICSDCSYFSLRRIADLMDSFGIPWAPFPGNHDREGNCDTEFICDTLSSSKLCLLRGCDADTGEVSGSIFIKEGGKTVEALVLLDSYKGRFGASQQALLEKISLEAAKDGAEVSVWAHEPIPDFQYAYDRSFSGGRALPGEGAFGEKHEEICCERDGGGSPVDRGFFEKAASLGNVKHFFASHDHNNDFSVTSGGMRMTYCLKAGHCSGFYKGFNGASVIKIGSSGIRSIEHRAVRFPGTKTLEIW